MIIARSYLYIPAIKEKYYENIDLNNSDAIIFDLEDSVTLKNKSEARNILLSFLINNKISKKIFIRVNSESEQQAEDIELINKLADKITGVFLPKVKTSKDITIFYKALLEKSYYIIPLIETPESILNLEKIVKNDYVDTVALGEVDLSTSLNIEPKTSYKQMIPIRLFINIVTAANKKHSPIGPVWLKINDNKGLTKHMNTMKELGYSGAQLIHPNQIEITNEIFSYTDDEVIWAKQIIKNSKDSLMNTGSFTDSNNEMVDEAIIKQARKIIETVEKDY